MLFLILKRTLYRIFICNIFVVIIKILFCVNIIICNAVYILSYFSLTTFCLLYLANTDYCSEQHKQRTQLPIGSYNCQTLIGSHVKFELHVIAKRQIGQKGDRTRQLWHLSVNNNGSDCTYMNVLGEHHLDDKGHHTPAVYT